MKILSLAILSTFITSSSLFGATLNPNITNNSLVIYNSNIGLVHEVRELNIKQNDTQIIYEDVASTINTDSVNVEFPKGISLFSQQYRFDKLTQNKLLNAHIGKSVSLKVNEENQKPKIIQATLLSNDGSRCIVKTEDENIISVESKNIIFKTIPKELITKPSLVWNIKAKNDLSSQLSLDYLISQISWSSNYILNVKEDKADLSGWITVDNRSGKSFLNTKLNVLAGDISRAYPQVTYKMARNMVAMADSAPEVAHQAHEGYHFYTIPFKVDISNNEKTQIKFISKNAIDIKRKYSVQMSNPNYLKGEFNRDVSQYITLKGFDFAMPKGVVRTYSKLKDTTILLGETSVKHTPKETPISLKIGKNFDVKVSETLINHDESKWSIEADIKYSIKNSSDKEKTVEILVPFNKNDASKVKSKQRYTFTKGNLVSFNIVVKPNSTKEFKASFKTKK